LKNKDINIIENKKYEENPLKRMNADCQKFDTYHYYHQYKKSDNQNIDFKLEKMNFRFSFDNIENNISN